MLRNRRPEVPLLVAVAAEPVQDLIGMIRGHPDHGPHRVALPHIAFNRKVGAFAGIEASPTGEKLSPAEWEQRKGQWLPTDTDKTFVRSLMRPVHERGKIAAWVAPPRNGINGKPFDYDYVHLA